MRRRLWLIGGTQESRQLVAQILAHVKRRGEHPLGKDAPGLLVTVTTCAARALYPETDAITLRVGPLTVSQAADLIASERIGAVLDASHPFATEISAHAIALAQRFDLPYLRYERPTVAASAEIAWQDAAGRAGNLQLPDFASLVAGGYLQGERTLLTVGYRNLSQVQPWQSQGTLYARILPSASALAAAIAAGFTADRLIALRPPVSPALEKALWQQWRITQVVTKASGQPGGEDHKLQVAAELKVRLIRISRPPVVYPVQTVCLQEAVQFGLDFLQASEEHLAMG